MAKYAYVGVNNVAQKVKPKYIGIETEFPIYETETSKIDITEDNVQEYFSLREGISYYFAPNGSQWITNNASVSNATATTTWTALQDCDYVKFSYKVSSESGYDKFTCTIKGINYVDNVSGENSGTVTVGVSKGDSIELTYKKDGSANNGEDRVVISNFQIQTTLQKQIGTEVRSVARKIKKAYVGVNGVARLWYESGREVVKHSDATALSFARRDGGSAAVGDYALFAGGFYTDAQGNGTNATNVDAYNYNLTRTSPTALGTGRQNPAGASVGNYAVFAGGAINNKYSDSVDAYNASLTRSAPTVLSAARQNIAGASVGNYALFAGGYSSSQWVDIVDTYNASLTRSNNVTLSVARQSIVSASVGNYALFASGAGKSGTSTVVEAFDPNLTRSLPTELSVARSGIEGARVGNYALFAGGATNDGSIYTRHTMVEVYDASLTRSFAKDMLYARTGTHSTTLDEFVIFAGGFKGVGTTSSITQCDYTDAYDESLTRSSIPLLSEARAYMFSATVGEYALFAGGMASNGKVSSTVEVYTLTGGEN